MGVACSSQAVVTKNTNKMKKVLFILLSISLLVATSCEKSEGTKAGFLQKASHKKFPCPYYVIEIAYEGGRAISTGENSSSYSNSQEFSVTHEQYDSLKKHVGEPIVFEYHDVGFKFCGESKEILTYKFH